MPKAPSATYLTVGTRPVSTIASQSGLAPLGVSRSINNIQQETFVIFFTFHWRPLPNVSRIFLLADAKKKDALPARWQSREEITKRALIAVCCIFQFDS